MFDKKKKCLFSIEMSGRYYIGLWAVNCPYKDDSKDRVCNCVACKSDDNSETLKSKQIFESLMWTPDCSKIVHISIMYKNNNVSTFCSDKDNVNVLISVFATEQRKLCEDICYSTLFFNRTQLRMAIASRYFGAFYRDSLCPSNSNSCTESAVMHQSCSKSNKKEK